MSAPMEFGDKAHTDWLARHQGESPEDPMLRYVREPYRSRIDRLAETCGPVTEVAIGDEGVYVTFTNGHGQVFG